MIVREYELMLDEETKHSRLELKESFRYGRDKFADSESICELMKEKYGLHKKADEYVYILAFNTKMRLLGIFELAHGTGDKCLVDVRGIFMRAVYAGAQSIIMVHNHPSGEVEPSRDDKLINRRVKDAGELMGIPLIDNIIIGSNSFYSFRSSDEIFYCCK